VKTDDKMVEEYITFAEGLTEGCFWVSDWRSS